MWEQARNSEAGVVDPGGTPRNTRTRADSEMRGGRPRVAGAAPGRSLARSPNPGERAWAVEILCRLSPSVEFLELSEMGWGESGTE